MRVEPIRDKSKVRDIIEYLKRENERNHILFLIGIFTGLRIGDILKLRVRDVRDRKEIIVKMQKTKTFISIPLNPELKRALKEYTSNKSPNDYLIGSREGHNKAISRTQAYRILSEVAGMFGVESIGCHSMRKTFGYHLYYSTGKDIVKVQKALGQADPLVTLRYIGVLKDDVSKGIEALKY